MCPTNYVELERIEDLLLCKICYEYMKTAVITPCSHNYCSLCIRKYLHYKTRCPACFEEVFEADLRVNKILDEIIENILPVKEKIKDYLYKQKILLTCSQKMSTANSSIKIKDSDQDFVKKERSDIDDVTVASENVSSCDDVKDNQKMSTASPHIVKDASSPSTSGASRLISFFTPKSSKNSRNVSDIAMVTCPVCKVDIVETNINRHLDDCLKRETLQNKPIKTQPKRKQLPKLVYNLMKEVELKRKLKEFGLSNIGGRKVLESRLQRYITLYNAECDKGQPRPNSILIKQCEDDENLERKMNGASNTGLQLINKNLACNMDDARKKYLDVHKSSFESLITKIKFTSDSRKSNARRTLLNETACGNENASCKKEPVRHDSNNIHDTIIEECEFENDNMRDLVSNAVSSPLTKYNNSPMNCLAIQYSPSSDNSAAVSECLVESVLDDDLFSDESMEYSSPKRQKMNSKFVDESSEFYSTNSHSTSIFHSKTKSYEDKRNDLLKTHDIPQNVIKFQENMNLCVEKQTENFQDSSISNDNCKTLNLNDFNCSSFNNDSTNKKLDHVPLESGTLNENVINDNTAKQLENGIHHNSSTENRHTACFQKKRNRNVLTENTDTLQEEIRTYPCDTDSIQEQEIDKTEAKVSESLRDVQEDRYTKRRRKENEKSFISTENVLPRKSSRLRNNILRKPKEIVNSNISS